MQRVALLTLAAFALLASGALAGDPAPSPTPAKAKLVAKKNKTTAEEKSEKTSAALDQLFDKEPVIRHPEMHMWGAAEFSVYSSHR